MEEVLVDRLLRDTAQLFSKSQNGTGRVRLEVDVDEGAQVRGDPKQLSQMFWNLVKNAAEAMPDGGRIVFATTTPGPTAGNQSELWIADVATGQATKLYDESAAAGPVSRSDRGRFALALWEGGDLDGGVQYEWTLDTNPGWATEGQWAWGVTATKSSCRRALARASSSEPCP